MLDKQKPLNGTTHILKDAKPARSTISHFQTLKSQVRHTNLQGFIVLTFSLVVEFYVNGSNIPDVDFDIGPSWAGLMPISGDPNETRKVRIF